MKNFNLTKDFTYQEFIKSDLATKLKISNVPSKSVLLNMCYTAKCLQEIRDIVGKPIKILSGYRSKELNSAVKGASNSQHLTGEAVDIICPDFGYPLDLAREIEKNCKYFDQLINEFNMWVHISFSLTPRRQTLTIKDRSEGYKPGLF